jgi:hypothetical protein
MSHHDNMTNLANYNRSILSPICGVVFSVTMTLFFLIYKSFGYDERIITMVIFVICAISILVSGFVIVTLQDKTLKLKDKEWRLQRKENDIEIKLREIEEREQRITASKNQIKKEQEALEKKKDAYVVFDFK